MTIIFNNCNYKYEVESIYLLFFPCSNFNVLFDVADYSIYSKEKNLIVITQNDNILIVDTIIDYTNYIDNIPIDTTRNSKIAMDLSKVLYKQLEKQTQKTPPWGTLTGIRPVLRVHNMFKKGSTYENILRVFKDDFLVSEEKAELAITIAKQQEDIYRSVNQSDFSLYVSIPFCKTRCSYCSFVSSAINNKKAKMLISPYVDKLCEELILTASLIKEKKLIIRSVYIGGGTPTAIEAELLEEITDTISKHFDLSYIKEYTIEAGRPDTITQQKLKVMKKHCTRISINPQTFNDNILKQIGREHSSQDTLDKYNMAKEMGFKNINMDFIAGLPNDTLDSFIKSIDTAIELDPSNITIHTLSIKRSSSMRKEIEPSSINNQTNTQAMVDYAINELTMHGYIPYYLYKQKNTLDNLENIGFYKGDINNMGYYNIAIMEEIQSIIALGAGAVSKIVNLEENKIIRSFNYKHIYEYINDFDAMLERKREFLQN